MARNLVQDGKKIKLPVQAAAVAGDFEKVGELNCVLESDEVSNLAVCMLEGVHTLAVIHGADVVIGDPVYWNGSAIDDVNTGTLVGHSIGAVSGAATTDLPIRLHN